jgi:type IV pilus assembly protein PilA
MSSRVILPRGFTLIELMIVVAIIGLLAAIGIPNYVKFQCRAKQTEAKSSLKTLYVAEETYRAEFNDYLRGDSAELRFANFVVQGDRRRYFFSVANGSVMTFTGSARARSAEINGDLWTVNQTGTLTNVVPGCN